MSAIDLLEKAAGHLKDRVATYDKPEGERSIGAAVEAFKAITGDGIMNTGERGWLFMAILKMVRSQQGNYRADNYEDGAAYFALMGESACEERNGGWTPKEIEAAAFRKSCDRADIEWPDESRIVAIGQSVNDGAAYSGYTLDEVAPDGYVFSDWVRWVAVDSDGEVRVYEVEPSAHDHGWIELGYKNGHINKVDPPFNFKNCIWELER